MIVMPRKLGQTSFIKPKIKTTKNCKMYWKLANSWVLFVRSLVVGCRVDSACFSGIHTSLPEQAERVFTANSLLVGAYSSQPVFHCDLHSFQENSQPERQPPTCGLTLTSHLHFITAPLPLIFRATQSYHLRIPSEIPEGFTKVIERHQENIF